MAARHSINEIDNKLIKLNLKRIEEYINVDTKIKLQCLICNHEWKVVLKSIFGGTGCPKCSNCAKLNNEIIDNRLNGRNIKRLEDFINTRTKIKWKCLKCNNIWKNRPANIMFPNLQGCPECQLGKNEKKCKKLIEMCCKYDYFESHKQFYFNNRRYIPDFYLEIGKNKIIIEYNGEQHYKPVRFNGRSLEKSQSILSKQQKRDKQFRLCCKKNNIILLEIPYYWKEDKIIEELQKLNNI